MHPIIGILLTFFVSKFPKSRSNSLSFTKIWSNCLFLPKMHIFYCNVMTLILYFALIFKWFELQMPDWTQMKDNFMQISEIKREKLIFSDISHKTWRKSTFHGNFLQKLIFRSQNPSKVPNHWSISSNLKNYIKLSSFWVQSGICSSNRLEMRATQRMEVMTM